MSTVGFIVELLDPVVVAAHAASAARPESLHYLPGALFLGLAAKALYADAEAEQSFQRFHAGSLRFGDALPVGADGTLHPPVPISLHRKKGSAATSLSDSAVYDFAAVAREPGCKQLRGREITLGPSATLASVETEGSLRTAISPETQLADDGLLFGYEALSAGQMFWGRIEADDAAMLEPVLAALEGEQLVGRSKMGEFGRVRISRAEAWSLTPEGGGDMRYVWFLSDAWLTSENGLPGLRPDPAEFGGGQILWQRSFLRTRYVAPYNAKWRRRTEAQTLIMRGSVLTVAGSSLEPGLARFGLGQERGLGLALVSASPPGEVVRALAAPVLDRPATASATETQAPETDLTKWLAGKQARANGRRDEDDLARAEVDILRRHYKAARTMAGRPVGPAATQWGSLAAVLAQGQDGSSVFGTDDDREEDQWGARFKTGAQATFRAYAAEIRAKKGADALRLIAARVRKEILREGWLAGQQEGPRHD